MMVMMRTTRTMLGRELLGTRMPVLERNQGRERKSFRVV
jgi:hypothetical protein